MEVFSYWLLIVADVLLIVAVLVTARRLSAERRENTRLHTMLAEAQRRAERAERNVRD